MVSYRDVNLTPGTKYYYRIRSYNDAGHSAYSSEISIYTLDTSGVTKTPAIAIVSPSDRATVATTSDVSFNVSDWDVEAAAGRPTHLHLFLDDTDTEAHFTLDPISVTVTAGFHQITLKLANKDHNFIGVEDTIEVTAQ